MNQSGEWSLSPAFDMTYNYRSKGNWTSSHQTTLNNKNDDFEMNEFLKTADTFRIKKPKEIIKQVLKAISQWLMFAEQAGISEKRMDLIRKQHCLSIE